MIGLSDSNLVVEDSIFDHTDRRRIRTQNSSLVVRNSEFVDIFPGDEPPSTDNQSEHIWGNTSAAGRFLLEGNIFGIVKGHNDAVDVDGGFRPDPVIEVRGNLFRGSGDDALDLEGDAHIEGNVFMNVHKDEFNLDPGESNGG